MKFWAALLMGLTSPVSASVKSVAVLHTNRGDKRDDYTAGDNAILYETFAAESMMTQMINQQPPNGVVTDEHKQHAALPDLIVYGTSEDKAPGAYVGSKSGSVGTAMNKAFKDAYNKLANKQNNPALQTPYEVISSGKKCWWAPNHVVGHGCVTVTVLGRKGKHNLKHVTTTTVKHGGFGNREKASVIVKAKDKTTDETYCFTSSHWPPVSGNRPKQLTEHAKFAKQLEDAVVKLNCDYSISGGDFNLRVDADKAWNAGKRQLFENRQDIDNLARKQGKDYVCWEPLDMKMKESEKKKAMKFTQPLVLNGGTPHTASKQLTQLEIKAWTLRAEVNARYQYGPTTNPIKVIRSEMVERQLRHADNTNFFKSAHFHQHNNWQTPKDSSNQALLNDYTNAPKQYHSCALDFAQNDEVHLMKMGGSNTAKQLAHRPIARGAFWDALDNQPKVKDPEMKGYNAVERKFKGGETAMDACPTFSFDRGTSNVAAGFAKDGKWHLHYKEDRASSWADRIMWGVHPNRVSTTEVSIFNSFALYGNRNEDHASIAAVGTLGKHPCDEIVKINPSQQQTGNFKATRPVNTDEKSYCSGPAIHMVQNPMLDQGQGRQQHPRRRRFRRRTNHQGVLRPKQRAIQIKRGNEVNSMGTNPETKISRKQQTGVV